MNESQATVRVKRSRRRTAAIQQLLQEYESSKESRAEFCRRHNLALSTLARYLRKYRAASGANQSLAHPGLLPVKIAMPPRGQAEKALVVVLESGHKVEVDVGFDASTLARLVAVLERM